MLVAVGEYNCYFLEGYLDTKKEQLAQLKKHLIKAGDWEDCEMEDKDLKEYTFYVVEDSFGTTFAKGYKKVNVNDEDEVWACAQVVKNVMKAAHNELIKRKK